MNISNFYELISEIGQAENNDELKAICLKFCELTKTSFYLLGVISKHSLYAPKISIMSNYPQSWLDYYLELNKQRIDPVVSYMLTKNRPILWEELLSLDQFNTAEIQVFMQQAREHGLINGLSVPLRSVSGEIAVFSIVTDISHEEGRKILDDALLFSHTFSTHLFEQYVAIQAKIEHIKNRKKLTKRETQCMLWACEGKTSWEISQIINITERTIIFHLNNSVKKLGASNRQHAVAKIIKNGLIQPEI
ncbi:MULTISPECIES: LuxR family transcriptional regulator [unclassified Colwellia]|uniref:LuxR family transcriptional regulator n=1 Tax=unclassified Colwellia TaxID=196834 RepID=UPI0015F44B20|nr:MULTISPECIES: LuxR family transcriptional regulator [unclassified Colwellia]MBA6257678.1 LuxR family transcriptional regulator [Colwellia sp. MB3u-28]MBA6259435.1 LuxR family transcriptional regulator [Colwellia sp. MB3u-41]MBA6304362.1 LuxR family transcriptional regulator [Colwellia sp. MB02u-14]